MTRIVSTSMLDAAATGGQTATVNEPSVASSGKRILVAGNWFASRSTDGGASWTFVDPFSEFPASPGGFCCDQVLAYVGSRRLWVWLLQYQTSGAGNIFRLAVSSTGAPGTWTWWDTRPTDIDPAWSGLWFDYPDLLAGPDHLWISFNLYGVADSVWERAVVVRFDLDDLDARGAVDRAAWSTQLTGALRFARGAGDTMWFAGHGDDNRTVHLFSWDDDGSQVDEFVVDISPWNERDYESPLADGVDWLARADGRNTGCWLSGDVVGIAWSAGADADHDHPFVRVAHLSLDTLDVVAEPDLWSGDRAWAYPAVGLNRRGDVAMSAFCGGGQVPVTHAVGWLTDDGVWDMASAAVSTHSPANEAWGDYVDVQPDPRRKTYCMASGFTLQGSSSRSGIVPEVVTFAP